jgi:hypothetical protein
VRRDASKNSPFFEIASVLMCLDHVARVIVNANHSIVRLAEKLGVVEQSGDGFAPKIGRR